MESISDLLKKKKELPKGQKFVTQEFQDLGLRLAEKLNDMSHKALYIKMAKDKDRRILVQAARYVADYPNPQKPARIFMWKVKQLEEEMKKEEGQTT